MALARDRASWGLVAWWGAPRRNCTFVIDEASLGEPWHSDCNLKYQGFLIQTPYVIMPRSILRACYGRKTCMRDEQMSYRGSVALGCVGLLMGITAACSGGSPSSPSTTAGGSSQLLGFSGVSSSPTGVNSSPIGSGVEALVLTEVADEVAESPEDGGGSAAPRAGQEVGQGRSPAAHAPALPEPLN